MLPLTFAGNSVAAGGLTYKQRVQALQSSHLIGYWTQEEPSGTVCGDYSGNGNNGVYSAVTLAQTGIGDGLTSGLFDNAIDSVANVYSANFNTLFNGQEMSFMIWTKVADWTGTNRYIQTFHVNASNRVLMWLSTDNNVQLFYRAGGVTKTINQAGVVSGNWLNFIYTVSLSNNRCRFYYNGVQVGADATGLGTWVGTLSPTQTLLGGTVAVGSWTGYLAHAAVWNIELTSAEVASIAVL